MSSLKTILGSRIATSADINGLFVPANSLSEHLKSYSEPAVFAADDCGRYNMGLGGSTAKVKIGERYFALLSMHQIKKGLFDFEQISLFNYETNKMATAQKAIFPIQSNEIADSIDCVLCEFTEPVLSGNLSRNGWYDVETDLTFDATRSAILVFAIGYPSNRNEIDYYSFQFSISPNAVIGTETVPCVSDRLSFKPINSLEYDPKGMSGSPVFGVHLSDAYLKVFMAGIVTEASKDQFHFLPLVRLRRFFNHALKE
ncbi:hypothetical protein HW561_08135 [Rhodobacteraceae bacterium B1Z28]|uniref:Trypsin-like peptidase n=1 Tax=Ruegeria haliotis TaxID=2747601 RepID=A0ABX2PPZ9_9RHOB|nr:hypothetical protein [Ruegeria haliotis]NVO55756.1 hypothetical protein [Ruegeria haliotis]